MTDALAFRLLFASGEFALLALVAAAALRWLKPAPRTAAFCWAAVLLKPLVSLALGSPLALWEMPRTGVAHAPSRAELSTAPASMDPIGARQPVGQVEFAHVADASPALLPSPSPAPLAADSAAAAAPPAFSGRRLPPLADLVVLGWLLGVAVLSVRSVRDRLRLRYWLASSTAAPPAILELAQQTATLAGLRRTPPVRVTTRLASPALVGVVRPIVLLPAWMASEGNADRRRFMLRWSLRHELAHFRQRDGLLLLLRELAQALFFFHPATWLVSRRLELALELACDRAIVRSPVQARAYARQLVAIREQAGHERALALGGAFVVRARLLERVRALVQEPWSRTRRGGVAAFALPSALLLATLAGTRLQARPSDGAMPADVVGARGETLRGRVVDAAAKPIAKAKVRLVRSDPGHFFDPAAPISVEEAHGTTDESGAFALKAPAPIRTNYFYALVAEAPDLIPSWKSSRQLADLRDATLVLSDADCPVEGRLIDLEGRPVAGATIKVVGVSAIDGIAFDDFLRMLDDPRADPDAASHLQWRVEPHAELPSELTTDESGRFQLRGVGLDRRLDLAVHAAGFEFTYVNVYTHPGLAFDARAPVDAMARMMADDFSIASTPRLGPKFTHALAPEERIAGVVVDATSGEPIADCQVFDAPMEGSCDDRTDEEGRFELTKLRRGSGGHYVGVRGPKGGGWVSRVVHVEPGRSLAPVEIKVALKRGIVVHGRITDPEKGRPGLAWVDFGAYPENPNGEVAKWSIDGTRTDTEGRYSLAVPPGPGVLMMRAVDSSEFCEARPQDFRREPGQLGYVFFGGGQTPNRYFQEVRYLDLPATATEHELDIALRRGHSLTLRVTDPEGRPVAHCQAFGSDGTRFHWEAAEGSEVSILALDAGVARRVLLLDAVAGGALVLDLTGEESGTRDVKLEPCAWITARLLDDDGKPSAGRPISGAVYLQESDYAGVGLPAFRSDAGGKLRAPLVPGLKHTFFLPKKTPVTLAPGEVKDLGELRFADDAIDGT